MQIGPLEQTVQISGLHNPSSLSVRQEPVSWNMYHGCPVLPD